MPGCAERAVSAVRGQPAPPQPELESMRLGALPNRGEWVLLGQDLPREIAFGAVGRFWAGETAWEEIAAEDFAGFNRPGLAKIAANFSLRPYGTARTLLSYECRTQATDPCHAWVHALLASALPVHRRGTAGSDAHDRVNP
jgi:hypothetical protein